ncbi:hypothetical protein N7478_012076 [Penicillium angulare]|uniref:uncharacterized protein n=1 Tax=Penicillium angulare TaxID=116970 RepID=UPI0025406260|nr:uncharacterized protein N7478_012076 [Penicillium angulare]KAJ5260471.1 hypothetical protein N7478_012076 [Penicillium angulare]
MGRPKKSRRMNNSTTNFSRPPLPSPSPSQPPGDHEQPSSTDQVGPDPASTWVQDDYGPSLAAPNDNFGSWGLSENHGNSTMGPELTPWSIGQMDQDGITDYFMNSDLTVSSLSIANEIGLNDPLHSNPSKDLQLNNNGKSTTTLNPGLTEKSCDEISDDKTHSLGGKFTVQASQRLTAILFELQSELISSIAVRTSTISDGKRLVSFVNTLCDVLFSEISRPEPKLDPVADIKLWSLMTTAVAITLCLFRSFCNSPNEEATPLKRKNSHDGASRLHEDRDNREGVLSMTDKTDRLALLACMEYQLTVFEKYFHLPSCQSMPKTTNMLQGTRDTKDHVRREIQHITMS